MLKSKLANGATTRMAHSSKQDQANRHSDSDYDDHDHDHLEYPPAVPEVPHGPPIPYRHPFEGESSGHSSAMSFSQRARGQMLAQDALEDNGYWDDNDDMPSNMSTPEDGAQITSHDHPKWSSQNGATVPDRERELQRDPLRRRADLPSPESPQSTPKARRATPHRLRHSADVAPLKTDLPLPSAQSKPKRGSAKLSDAQPREWAPDRSPLQTLEVKLNDISKEEKRARVEEAEMLLRESKAGRGGRRSNRDVQPASKRSGPTKEPIRVDTSTHGPRLDRGSSDMQHDQLHRRSHVESQRPNGRFPSGEDRPAPDHHEQKLPERPVADKVSRAHDLSRPQRQHSRDGGQIHPAHGGHGAVASGKSGRGSFQDTTDVAHGRPVHEPHFIDVMGGAHDESASHPEQWSNPTQNQSRRATSNRLAPVAQSIPSNITRAVSLQQRQPQPSFPEDHDTSRSGPIKESNSSHKAALAEATAGVGPAGATAATSIKRDNSRKLQKAPPGNLNRGSYAERGKSNSMDDSVQQVSAPAETPRSGTNANNQDHKVEHYYKGMPKQVNVHRSNSQQAPDPVGLSPKEPRVAEQNNATSRPRQTSVSFKVPFNKARPVDEWKHASTARLTLADLAFDSPGEHDQAWWEMHGSSTRRRSNRSAGQAQISNTYNQQRDTEAAEFRPPLYLKCGPLLRYTGTRRDRAERQSGQPNSSIDRETWRGSVMIVTRDSQSSYEEAPTLRIFSQPKDLLPPPPQQVQNDDLAPEYVDPIAGLTKVSRRGEVLYVKPVDHVEEGQDLSRIENDDGLFEASPSPLDNGSHGSATPNKRTRGRDGESLGKYQEVKGVRLYADIERDVTFWRFNIEVELGQQQAHIAYRINRGPCVGFWVPAKGQTMNIMFHSCNGFSLSVNADQFSGPDPLWRDVLNTHQTRPFHVMIGGGDQLYNDRVMVETDHFAAWTQLRNPHDKNHAPFTEEMREELESFYLDRYAMWFSQGLFGLANSQIPMVNIYDDHDIIDGFGSYPDDFQRAPVFMGIGNIAFKYYMLFQHQSVPEETQADEPSWLLGAKPGPYIQQLSRSVFLNLGQSVAFLGLDCRTERERYSVLTDDTYEIVLDRCRREIIEGETKHLLVLVGVPMAYPRLVWLENILTSRAMTPVKALGRAGIFRGGFLNKFDGGVEVLDDLDDHWTATGHKEERNNLIHDLQDLAAEKSIRVTILGGDVHLGAVGQFYTNPELKIPKDRDHRYIPNVISSAIVNTPPPEMLADTLNKRNKVHHLDPHTVEDMIPMFTHDVDGKKRNNKRLLPRRNWCSIREYHPGFTPPPTPPDSPTLSDQMSESEDHPAPARRRFSFSREDGMAGKLLQRLSQRGAPPSSYRDDMNITGPTATRRASHDGYFSNPHEPQTAPATRTSFPMGNGFPGAQPQTAPPNRTSFNSTATADYNHRASIDAIPSRPNPRPGIFRRPTNLSEKAARKGGGEAMDSEGNLLGDLNDHINLDGGLDITLNCEVTQGDPAGITTPYRLLVPALSYDGSSDRQKLDDAGATGGGIQRKPTLLKKLGFGRTGNRSVADRQGQGNWGQESESGSETLSEGQYSDEDDDSYYGKGNRSSGGGLKRWFSGRRGTGKQERRYSSPEYDRREMYPPSQHQQRGGQPADEMASREPRTAPVNGQHEQPHQSSQNTNTYATNTSPNTYDQPPSEPFPSHARGKAARVMGVDQDQDQDVDPPPRSLSQHPPQQHMPSHPATSLNQSQPLPPLSPQAAPTQQQGHDHGINKSASSRYYEKYNLAQPGFGPQGRGAGRGRGRGGGIAQLNDQDLDQVPRGYTGLEAYPGKAKGPARGKMLKKKWF